MSILESAIRLAVEVHEGQRDKAGAPYILHPLRVMASVEGEDAKIVAVLHDVIEDAQVEGIEERVRAALSGGDSKRLMAALDALTKRDGEGYEAFIERVAPNDLARRVKLADLQDNMDVRRLRPEDLADPWTQQRLLRYRRAFERLSS